MNDQTKPHQYSDIEVVPRTQQEIDDYGPNGIQPPKPYPIPMPVIKPILAE